MLETTKPNYRQIFKWVALIFGLALAVLVVVPILMSVAARAKTTTFNAGDCDPNVTISDPGPSSGLTVTASLPAPGGFWPVVCQANVGKYSGKWYFRATTTNYGNVIAVGVARPGWAASTIGQAFGAGLGSTNDDVGYIINHSQVVFAHPPVAPNTSATFTYTPGKTIGVAVDFDSNPQQIWVTADITDTSGCGGGPVWNGDTTTWGAPVAAAPATAHYPCGGPGTGTGKFGPPDTGQTGLQFFLNGAYPAVGVQGAGTPSGGTFDFNDSATLDAKIPGYLPWNTSGGGPTVPGPLNPVVRNIANAPAWQQNTTYRSFPNDDRVLAGPAYDPGTGLFTSGLPVYLWAVAPGGGGTSGNNSTYAGHFGTAPCPMPANVGGTVAPGVS